PSLALQAGEGMKDFSAELGKKRMVALYAHLTSDYCVLFEVGYSHFDETGRPLPVGERRERPMTGYVRISEPVELSLRAITSDEMIQGAVAALDAEERKAIEQLNQTLANIRERKQQLLAITYQSEPA